MKWLSMLMLMLLSSSCLRAQQEVSILTGAEYAQDVYYSFSNGEVARVDRNNWDLAFEVDIPSAIRINSGAGTQAWLVSTDTLQWTAIDTTGQVHPDSALQNAPDYWGIGALNQPINVERNDDVGWGIYDFITHELTGDRLYVIKTRNQAWHKLWIRQRAKGKYVVWSAPLGSNEVITTDVVMANYKGKMFAYLNLENGELLDREPPRSDWNLLFSKYIDYVPAGPGLELPYPVTGVLTNSSQASAQLDDIDVSVAQDTSGLPWTDEINVIGSDWKSFNLETNSYSVVANRAYFVREPNGTIWKLVFTDFGGSANGRFVFTQQNLGSGVSRKSTIEEQANRVWPNPAKVGQAIYIDVPEVKTAKLVDIQGRELMNSPLQEGKITLHEIPQGFYVLILETNKGVLSSRVWIEN